MADDAMAPDARAQAMNAVNPVYVPRNHLVEGALKAAVGTGEMTPFKLLLDIAKSPFEPKDGLEAYAQPASAAFGAGYKTFCGT